jgi:hypothetical protein
LIAEQVHKASEQVAKAIAAVPPPKEATSVVEAVVNRDGHLVLTLSDGAVKDVGMVVGRDADMDAVHRMVSESVDIETVREMVTEQVTKAFAAVKLPKDGKDGTSVDIPKLLSAISAEVDRAVKSLPEPKPGQNGTSVTLQEVEPVIQSAVAKAVAAIELPKDGVGISSAVVNRAGHLVLAMSDGSTKDVGIVAGKDADSETVQKMVADAVAKIPSPEKGQDGADGLGIDDFDVEHDGEQTFTFKWANGSKSKTKEFFIPVPVDKGPWKQGDYKRGQVVTWDGCAWSARRDTSEQPAYTKDGAWRLMVKKGRDAKGQPGPRGPKGDPGDPAHTW